MNEKTYGIRIRFLYTKFKFRSMFFFFFLCTMLFMKNILLLGSVHYDFLSVVTALPKGNEPLDIQTTTTRLTGMGYVVSSLLQAMGFSYTLVTGVGSGIYGDAIVQNMQEESLPLPKAYSDIEGCTYTLKDPKGNTVTFAVPGYDHAVPLEELKTVDLSSFDCIALSGDLFLKPNAKELFGLLKPYTKKCILFMNEESAQSDLHVLANIFSMHATMHVSANVAMQLLKKETSNALDLLNELYEENQGPVIVMLEDGGCLYTDGNITMETPVQKGTIKDKSLREDIHFAFYLLAVLSGVSVKGALEFSDQCTSRMVQKESFRLEDKDLQEIKARLVSSLTYEEDRRKA